MARAIHAMFQFFVSRNTITRRRIGKHRIHQRQNGLGGPEGHIKRHGAKFLAGSIHDILVMGFLPHETLGIRALEGIDGLLLIADGEDAALVIPRAKTGEKFRR
jgi:hypothetical protein